MPTKDPHPTLLHRRFRVINTLLDHPEFGPALRQHYVLHEVILSRFWFWLGQLNTPLTRADEDGAFIILQVILCVFILPKRQGTKHFILGTLVVPCSTRQPSRRGCPSPRTSMMSSRWLPKDLCTGRKTERMVRRSSVDGMSLLSFATWSLAPSH